MYINSPFNYTGSKYDLLEKIFPYFPNKQDVNLFVDLFVGGGSVFINTEYDNVLINDVITPLIDLYQDMYSCEMNELESKIMENFIAKDDQNFFNEKRKEFNENGNPYIFFNLVCSCTNNMMRFNKSFKFNQTFGKRNYNDKTREKLSKYVERIKTKNILFSNNNFLDVVKSCNNKGTFFYMDPPYLITEAGYNAFWSKEHEENLYESLDIINKNGNKFLLSNVVKHKGRENKKMMELYSKYDVVEIEKDYEKVSKKTEGETIEVIVKNY